LESRGAGSPLAADRPSAEPSCRRASSTCPRHGEAPVVSAPGDTSSPTCHLHRPPSAGHQPFQRLRPPRDAGANALRHRGPQASRPSKERNPIAIPFYFDPYSRHRGQRPSWPPQAKGYEVRSSGPTSPGAWFRLFFFFRTRAGCRLRPRRLRAARGRSTVAVNRWPFRGFITGTGPGHPAYKAIPAAGKNKRWACFGKVVPPV